MDGEGARLNGGRWNSEGYPAVYLAESRALAALEILVHAPRELLKMPWSVLEIEVPDDFIVVVPPAVLPDSWRKEPKSVDAQELGSRWLHSRKNLALLLPSVIVPEEKILLLNPRHPDMAEIRIGKEATFTFDPRLAV
jgi:RES domain-containing protein